MFKPYNNTNQTWADALIDIRNAKKEISENSGIMTAYERKAYRDSVNERIQSNYSNIYNGAKRMLFSEIENYKNAKSKVEKEKAKEIDRWDYSRLNAELDYMKKTVQNSLEKLNANNGIIGNEDNLINLLNEVKTSESAYKKRAFAEVMENISLDGMQRQTMMKVIPIVNEAKAIGQETRITEGIKEASVEVLNSAKSLWEVKNTFREIANLMDDSNPGDFFGGGTPFSKVYKMVEFDRSTGEPIFYSEDDPHITGITLKTSQAEQEG